MAQPTTTTAYHLTQYKKFCDKYTEVCNPLTEQIKVINGDFNFTLKDSDYESLTNAPRSRKRLTEAYFTEFLRTHELNDLQESLYPDLKAHTYKKTLQWPNDKLRKTRPILHKFCPTLLRYKKRTICELGSQFTPCTNQQRQRTSNENKSIS